MPEVWFTLRWPDESEETCYSPSSVIHDHLKTGAVYPLEEFAKRIETGLNAASSRVEKMYGYPCSRAKAQLLQIERRVDQFRDQSDAVVTCLNLKTHEGA